jgi:hypothetical protein
LLFKRRFAHGTNAKNLVIWYEAEMPAFEAYTTATTTNAMLLGIENEMDR